MKQAWMQGSHRVGGCSWKASATREAISIAFLTFYPGVCYAIPLIVHTWLVLTVLVAATAADFAIAGPMAYGGSFKNNTDV